MDVADGLLGSSCSVVQERMDDVSQPLGNLRILVGNGARRLLSDSLDHMSNAIAAKRTVAGTHGVHHATETEQITPRQRVGGTDVFLIGTDLC